MPRIQQHIQDGYLRHGRYQQAVDALRNNRYLTRKKLCERVINLKIHNERLRMALAAVDPDYEQTLRRIDMAETAMGMVDRIDDYGNVS